MQEKNQERVLKRSLTTDMDMLHGRLAGKLLRFTRPIALSSMVQQLFNAADTAVGVSAPERINEDQEPS